MKYTLYICKKNNTTRDLDVVIKKDTKKMALRRVWPMDKETKRRSLPTVLGFIINLLSW
jgi:hypothetical protein